MRKSMNGTNSASRAAQSGESSAAQAVVASLCFMLRTDRSCALQWLPLGWTRSASVSISREQRSYCLEAMHSSRPFPVAILAGGMATRLRPISENVPKSLIEVAGQPFVIRQLRYLGTQGIDRAVLCVGHLGDQIEAIVGNGSEFGLQVTYSFDGPKLLGTGGALRQALPLLGEYFFVLYGDSFLPVDFGSIQQAFVASTRPALMTVL